MVAQTELSAVLILFLTPVIYAFCITIKWMVKKRRIAHVVDKIPGPEREWLLGNMRQIPFDGERRLTEWDIPIGERFKKAFSFRYGPFLSAVALIHPSTVKLILKTDEPKQMSDNTGYSLLLSWLGRGLLINNGKSWFRKRRLLTPAFHFDVLQPYVKIYNQAADIFLEKCQNHESDNPKSSMEMSGPISLCTLDVMLRCAFSFTDDVQRQGSNHPYVKTVGELSHLFMKRIFNPLLYFDPIYHLTSNGRKWKGGCEFAHNVAYDLIKKRRFELTKIENIQAVVKKKKRAIDFLDILLLAKDEDGISLTDEEIRVEVDTFLFEGHDTTASAITWCMYYLASHPVCQEKARNEIDTLLEGRSCYDILWADLSKMPYLTMCIKETLRNASPVPMVARELENPLTIEGVTLIPGTFVGVNIWNLHHNPLVWGEDYMEFKPERFHPDKTAKMDSHSFIPFSAGPRNCIGQNFAMNEIKVFMAKVLNRFELSVDTQRLPRRNPELVMRTESGLFLNVIERT